MATVRKWATVSRGSDGKAVAALENAKKVRAGTQRERDYIDAVAVYYEDWATRGERARQAARADAFEKLAAQYPQDDEAQIFYALYRAGTQLQTDQTYAAYIKAASQMGLGNSEPNRIELRNVGR